MRYEFFTKLSIIGIAAVALSTVTVEFCHNFFLHMGLCLASPGLCLLLLNFIWTLVRNYWLHKQREKPLNQRKHKTFHKGETTNFLMQLIRFVATIKIFKVHLPVRIGWTLLWSASICFALSYRLGWIDSNPQPPAIWYKFGDQKPQYKRSLLITVQILKEIAPGRYLVTSVIDKQQIRRSYKKRYKKKRYSYKKKGHYKYTTHFKKNKNRRKKYKKKSRSNYRYHRKKKPLLKIRKKHKRKFRYRSYAQRWHTYSSSSVGSRKKQIVRNQIRAILSLKLNGVHSGCQIQMRYYGRGVAHYSKDKFMSAYLKRQNVSTMWRASARYHVLKLNCPAPELRTRLQQHLRSSLKTAVEDSAVRGLMYALLMGRSAYLPYQSRRSLAALGVLHLFAASGLHLGILFACLYIPLAMIFGRSHWISHGLALLPCLCLGWFCDWPISIARALCFLVLHAIFKIFYKRISRDHLLVMSGSGVLLIDPLSFIGVGSLLSFAAVTGILYGYPAMMSLWHSSNKAWRYLQSHCAVSISASFWTTPVVIVFFRLHAFAGSIFNLILVPIVGLALPFLYLAVLLSFFEPTLEISIYMLTWIGIGFQKMYILLCQPMIVDTGITFENRMPPVFWFSILAPLLLFTFYFWQRRWPEQDFWGRFFRKLVLVCFILLQLLLSLPGWLLWCWWML